MALRLLEFFTYFNWLILPEVIFGTLRRARWRRAYAQRGAGGLVLEAAESVIGMNSFMFAVPLTSHWDGWSIDRLLSRYGIEMWGWGFYDHQMFFHIRREDASAAYDIMLRAGVDLVL